MSEEYIDEREAMKEFISCMDPKEFPQLHRLMTNFLERSIQDEARIKALEEELERLQIYYTTLHEG